MNNKKTKYKKKRNFKSQSEKTKKFFDEYGTNDRDEGTNDPAWYARYPELMRDAASLPYSIPTGTKISWDVDTDAGYPLTEKSNSVYVNAFQSIPGIMTIGIAPAIGVSKDATTPVNVAMKMLYTKVRAENSGARNYDAPDLMLYCLSMDQIYSLITWFNRIYGTLMLYSQVNRYMPKALLDAQHVDFDDLILHINDFKAFLDTATAQAAVFSVPNDMALFNRHAFMYQNIYKDAESPKSQLYQYAPRLFYQYDELNGAGYLKAIDIIANYPNSMKFTDLVHLFHSLMDPIIASEDFNIMSGDILKAFGEGGLIKLQIMPQGYTVFPIADYEVLTQIKNATMTNFTTTLLLTIGSSNLDITQDANVEFLVYDPYFTHTSTPSVAMVHDRMLSTYKTAPEPADNMVVTRLMYTLHENEDMTDPSNPIYEVHFDAVGSEYVTSVAITQFHYDANGAWVAVSTNINVMSESILGATLNAGQVHRLWMAKHFDYCPAIYMLLKGSNQTLFYPFFDTDNWTIVHSYELEKMHRTALMSLLRVPMIGSALPSNMK